jgi:polysaccharide export outer membrane protein
MRLSGLFIVLMLAPALGACASLPPPRVSEVPRAPLVLPPTAAWATGGERLRDGDSLPRVMPPATVAAAPPSRPTPASFFSRFFLRGSSAPVAPVVTAASAPSAAWASDLDSLRYGSPTLRGAPAPVAAAAPARWPNPLSFLSRIFQRATPAPAGLVAPDAPAPVTAMATAPESAAIVVPVAMVEPDQPYTFDTGDRLRITVFGQDGISNSYVVDAQGNISMPLIGTVAVRALSNEGLARLIAERLRKGFIREPHVSVEVEIYRPFFILGEVLAPGQYPYVPNMTVQTAVAIAGGYTPRAYRADIGVDRPAPGGVVRQTVPPLTRIKPGDTIVVKERWF